VPLVSPSLLGKKEVSTCSLRPTRRSVLIPPRQVHLPKSIESSIPPLDGGGPWFSRGWVPPPCVTFLLSDELPPFF